MGRAKQLTDEEKKYLQRIFNFFYLFTYDANQAKIKKRVRGFAWNLQRANVAGYPKNSYWLVSISL